MEQNQVNDVILGKDGQKALDASEKLDLTKILTESKGGAERSAFAQVTGNPLFTAVWSFLHAEQKSLTILGVCSCSSRSCC